MLNRFFSRSPSSDDKDITKLKNTPSKVFKDTLVVGTSGVGLGFLLGAYAKKQWQFFLMLPVGAISLLSIYHLRVTLPEYFNAIDNTNEKLEKNNSSQSRECQRAQFGRNVK